MRAILNALRRIGLLAAAGGLIAIYAIAFVRDLSRPPHVDEVEYLHASLRMAHGERIYVDFAEHHPPLFFASLVPLTPKSNTIAAMQAYVTRGRAAAALCAALAIAAAALFVWRATNSAVAVLTMIALTFFGGAVWRNGLADIRPDSLGLACWWSGAALALFASRGVVRGAGAGLVVLSALVIPKWPLETLVVLVFVLIDARRQLLSTIIAAVITSGAAVAATALLADLRAVWFHVFVLTRNVVTLIYENASPPHYFDALPPILRPLIVACATLAIVFLRKAPKTDLFLVALTVAVWIEIVWIYPAPPAPRYYVFWCILAPMMIAIAVHRLAALRTEARVVPIVALVLAVAGATQIIYPPYPAPAIYWRASEFMQQRLATGDSVWLETKWHPIGARDASYYWFQFSELVPAAIQLARTDRGRRFLPPIAEGDLPPCRIERGLDRRVRFIAWPERYGRLPEVAACFERLRASGRVAPTPFREIWMVSR